MQTKPIQFYFEFASTYSYLAVMRIEALAQQKGIPIVWKPFLLGPIFKEQDWQDSPFNIYPTKGRYMWRDTERLCQKHQLAFHKPSRFPQNGLKAARIAHLTENQAWNPDFIKKVFQANFVEDRDISKPNTLIEILKSLKQNGQKILEASETEENKASLKKQTISAKDLGIFGAPSFIVAKELFWGHDRMEEALEWCLK